MPSLSLWELDKKNLKQWRYLNEMVTAWNPSIWITTIRCAKNSLEGAISADGKDWEISYRLESALNFHPWVVKVPIILAVFSGSLIRKTELASSSPNEGLGFHPAGTNHPLPSLPFISQVHWLISTYRREIVKQPFCITIVLFNPYCCMILQSPLK